MRTQQIIAAVARRLNIQVVREILCIDGFARVSGLQLCMACVSPEMRGYSNSHSTMANRYHGMWHLNPANSDALASYPALNFSAWQTAEAETASGKLKRFPLATRLSGLAKRGIDGLRTRTS